MSLKAFILATLSLSTMAWADPINSRDRDNQFLQGISGYLAQESLQISVQDTGLQNKRYLYIRARLCDTRTKINYSLRIHPLRVDQIPEVYDACAELAYFSPHEPLEDQVMLVTAQSLMAKRARFDVDSPSAVIRLEAYEIPYFHKRPLAELEIPSSHFFREMLFSAQTKIVSLETKKKGNINLLFKVAHAKTGKTASSKLNSSPNLQPLLVIDVLSQEKRLHDLFAADSGVWENYSIKEHSMRVMENLNEQFDCLFTPDFQQRMRLILGMPLKNFMQETMALHDIGKPLAIEAGDKDRQHEFTRPILEEALTRLHVPKKTILISATLVDNDVIGDYLMNKFSAEEAGRKLRELAQAAGLDVQDYWKLQIAFYTADAGAYPSLAQRVFEQDAHGCISPFAERFKRLQKVLLL